MCDIRKWSSFILLQVALQFLPTAFIEKTAFSTLYILPSFVIDLLTIKTWVYFWVLYHVLLICVPIFMPISYCFDYHSFVVCLEILDSDSSKFVPLSEDCLAIQSLSWVHENFRIIHSSSVKNGISILIGIAFNL